MNKQFISYLKSNNIEKMLELVKKGFDVNSIYNLNGDNYLILAILTKSCTSKTIKFLLDFKANPNSKNSSGFTPLMTAALRDRHEIVQMLLKRGADINATTMAGWTALTYAAENNNNKVINALFKSPELNINIVDTHVRTAFIEACFHGNPKAAEELIKKNAHALITDIDGEDALSAAIDSASSSTCEIVLKYISKKIIDTVYLDKMGHITAEQSTHHIMTALLKNGLNPNSADENNKTIMMKAAEVNNHNIVDSLIKYKADPNLSDNEGNTALIYACLSDPVKKTIETLVKAGADVSHVNKDGRDAYSLVEEIADDYVVDSAQKQRATKSYKKEQEEILRLLSSKVKSQGKKAKPLKGYADNQNNPAPLPRKAPPYDCLVRFKNWSLIIHHDKAAWIPQRFFTATGKLSVAGRKLIMQAPSGSADEEIAKHNEIMQLRARQKDDEFLTAKFHSNRIRNFSHRIILTSDAKFSRQRICVYSDLLQQPIFYGVDPKPARNQCQSEMNAALKALELVKTLGQTFYPRQCRTLLCLNVDAEILINSKSPRGYNAHLRRLARYYNIGLEINWIKGENNPADKYTVNSGELDLTQTPAPELRALFEKPLRWRSRG